MTDAERLVRDFIGAWNDRDYAALHDLVAPSYVMIDPASPDGNAHGAVGAEAWLREIVEGFPDFTIDILDSLADENVVMVELRYSGTHEGEFQGVPSTGRTMELQGMEKHEIENGRLCRSRVYLNDQALRDQLGLTFPGVIGQLPALLWRKAVRT